MSDKEILQHKKSHLTKLLSAYQAYFRSSECVDKEIWSEIIRDTETLLEGVEDNLLIYEQEEETTQNQ